MRTIRIFVVAPLLAVLAAAALLPLIEVDTWWVRYFDFLQVQIAIAVIVLAILFLALGGWRHWLGIVLLGTAVIALAVQVPRLGPFLYSSRVAVDGESCADGAQLRLLVANVKQENRQFDQFRSVIDDAAPDVIIALETGDWWDERLSTLGDYPYAVQHIPAGPAYYGMHVLSRYELLNEEVLFYFGTDTPTIRTDIRLPGGELVTVFGMHPRPPQVSQPTTMRDGHLLRAALEVRDSEYPVVLAGDFNATPWETVNRQALRVGELLDPRIGRGLYPTFRMGPGLSWPLDQVLFQEQLVLTDWAVLPSIGSDHLPVLAELCLDPEASALQEAPAADEGDLSAARAAIRAAEDYAERQSD